MFDGDTPCEEFLARREGRSAAEGMRQPGLSRATCFRRMEAMRERVAECGRIDAGGSRSPGREGERRLAAALGSVR